MKLASFTLGDRALYGLADGSDVRPVTEAFATRYRDLRSVLTSGALQSIELAPPVPQAKVAFLPPVPNPSKIVCVGLNYEKPYPVDGTPPGRPEEIVLFGKEQQCVVGNGVALEIPPGKAAESFDYEAEIAVIIGRGGRCISTEDALAHVAGYTCFNDGSVRDWQRHSVYAGKNFERSGACGPWLVTADEIADWRNLHLTARLNGELVQDAVAAEMIFGLERQISYISQLMTLLPGDVIATGSPHGTGGSRDPKRFLRAGDIVEISISGVGTLTNTVIG